MRITGKQSSFICEAKDHTFCLGYKVVITCFITEHFTVQAAAGHEEAAVVPSFAYITEQNSIRHVIHVRQ